MRLKSHNYEVVSRNDEIVGHNYGMINRNYEIIHRACAPVAHLAVLAMPIIWYPKEGNHGTDQMFPAAVQ